MFVSYIYKVLHDEKINEVTSQSVALERDSQWSETNESRTQFPKPIAYDIPFTEEGSLNLKPKRFQVNADK